MSWITTIWEVFKSLGGILSLHAPMTQTQESLVLYDIKDHGAWLRQGWGVFFLGVPLIPLPFLHFRQATTREDWLLGALFFGTFCVVPIVAGLRIVLEHVRESVVAGPGTATVSKVPVAPGDRIRLTLERPWRVRMALSHVRVSLVLCERVRGWTTLKTRDRFTVTLPHEEVRCDGPAIRAEWEVHVHEEAKAVLEARGEDSLGFVWELRVRTACDAAPGMESLFAFACDHGPLDVVT